MSLKDITSPAAVRKAIREFDQIGSERFLAKYGYGPAKKYHLIHDDARYPSKAILGVAHGYEHPSAGPLINTSFTGGKQLVVPKLQSLGFKVIQRDSFVRTGDVISNAELSKSFSVGNMGGMRRSRKQNHLVLISDSTKGLYDDRWEGDTLHYTGMGKSGDQSLTSQNKTLAESPESGITVHLFEVFSAKKYSYAGEVFLSEELYVEKQVGEDGKVRNVTMFPLQLAPGAQKLTPSQQDLANLARFRSNKLRKKSIEELRRRAELAPKKPQKRHATTTQIVRNMAVVEYVKKAAKGICDLCGKPSPFVDKKGQPYLECHHVTRLADGGDDWISNAVALCANCHRKMHVLAKNQIRPSFVRRSNNVM